GDVLGVDPANSHALAMDFEHDLGRLLPCHGKETLQHDDDEFHRGVVVVQKDHLEKGRRFELGLLGLEQSAFSHPGCHTLLNLCQKLPTVNPPGSAASGKITHPMHTLSIGTPPFSVGTSLIM